MRPITMMQAQWKAQTKDTHLIPMGKNLIPLDFSGKLPVEVGKSYCLSIKFKSGASLPADWHFEFIYHLYNDDWQACIESYYNGSRNESNIFNGEILQYTHTDEMQPEPTINFKSITPNMLEYLQWEEGTAPTTYEPFIKGETLQFNNCKGGYFSTTEQYGLKVTGQTAQDELTGKNMASSPDNYFPFEYEKEYILSFKVKDNVEIPEGTVYGYATETNNYGRNTIIEAGQTYYLRVPSFVEEDIVTKIYPYGSPEYIEWVQWEEGTVPTAYEPYCGGQQAPNMNYPQEIQCVEAGTAIKCFGKNLFDYETIYSAIPSESGVYFADSSISSSHPQQYKRYFKPEEIGKTLIFSIEAKQIGNASTSERVASIIDGAEARNFGKGEYTDDGYNICRLVVTPTSTNDCIYIDMTTGGGQQLYFRKVQLEYGNLRTEFEPHRESRAITPCDLYEGDIWYPTTGTVLRNTYKAENIQVIRLYARGDNFIRFYESFDGIIPKKLSKVYCNRFTEAINSGAAIGQNAVFVGENPRVSVFIKPEDFGITSEMTDNEVIATFNSWLEDNPTAIVYERETAVIEEYEPQPIFGKSGEVTVIHSTSNLKAELSATMLVRR